MREFEGKVAVVTGGASGLGRAFAERFAREDMKVVLGDVEEDALETTVLELRQQERDVTGVLCDVSIPESVEELARKALDAYGKVHILFNNAGVGGGGEGGRVWEHSLEDWQWTFGVNWWGVVHGIRTFLPIMLEQDEEAHVVNTASIAGLVGGSGLDIYGATKHAVVRVSEALHFQLAELDSKVKSSVLCPGFVSTNIRTSWRNRPDELWAEGVRPSAEELERRWAAREAAQAERTNVIEPDNVAQQVFEAVRDEQFYIITHDHFDDGIRMRMENILQRRNPALPPLT
ncbi:MAG: SDR family NAD(P)-dependent oxidoreductase [Dehalococcoidia bacterium]|jgi:NAD(P)-dependent dehydrogenase (short-subunit alcohol dehydrogenase family)|nr:SDR family NAD(P)-dependent oxidoreductase [Dehalococcoidia bacterium]